MREERFIQVLFHKQYPPRDRGDCTSPLLVI